MVTSDPSWRWRAFSNFKFWSSGVKLGTLGTTKAQIFWSFMVCDCQSGGFGLIVITRIDNGHFREHLHQTDILEFDGLPHPRLGWAQHVMRKSSHFYDCRQCSADFGHTPSCGKVSKSSRKRNFSPNGKSCSDAHHVGWQFYLKKTLGMMFKLSILREPAKWRIGPLH